MKYIFTLLCSLLLYSCAHTNYQSLRDEHDLIYNSAHYNFYNNPDSVYRMDDLGFMCMYMSAFVRVYYEQPKNFEFLMKGFDYMSYLQETREHYALQYELMEKYKKDLLLYTDDSITAIFYKKLVPENAIAAISFTGVEYSFVEGYEKGLSYFNKKGYCINNDEQTERIKKERLLLLYKYKDQDWKKDSSGFRECLIVEYISGKKGLLNARTKTELPVGSSPFLIDIQELLEKLCKEYKFSRIVMPVLIPANSNISVE